MKILKTFHMFVDSKKINTDYQQKSFGILKGFSWWRMNMLFWTFWTFCLSVSFSCELLNCRKYTNFLKKYFMILTTTILFINIIEINDNLISHSVDLVDKLDMHSFLPIDNFGSHAWWEQNLRPRRLRNHFFFSGKKYSNY